MPNSDAFLAAKRQRLDLADARLAPALARNARDHRDRLSRVSERLARHSPALALARARERLARIGDAPRLALRHHTDTKTRELAYLARRLALARDTTLERARTREARRADRLATVHERLIQASRRLIERRREHLDRAGGLLGSLSYRAVLARGFALVRDEMGAPLRSAAAARDAVGLTLEFADGTLSARPEPDVSTGDAPARPKRPSRRAARIETEVGPATKQGTLFEL